MTTCIRSSISVINVLNKKCNMCQIIMNFARNILALVCCLVFGVVSKFYHITLCDKHNVSDDYNDKFYFKHYTCRKSILIQNVRCSDGHE